MVFNYCSFTVKPREDSPHGVILHQFPRGAWAPSASPFPLKLETYMRMANISYKVSTLNIYNIYHYCLTGSLSNYWCKFQNDFKIPMSPRKQKCPWITCEGIDVADSQFSVEYLGKKFGKNLNIHLTRQQLAVSRSFQKMLEENTYWCVIQFLTIMQLSWWEGRVVNSGITLLLEICLCGFAQIL